MARLLHDFNTEFGDPTPGVPALAARLRELWVAGLDAYLEELYVVPARRGQGFGRALLEEAAATARRAGAVRMEIATSETDDAARALYESAGFTNREGGPDGPVMLFYEREVG